VLSAWPLDNVFSGTAFDHFTPLKMLLFVNATMLVWSLWPRERKSQYGKLPSDGLGLWRAWRRPQSEIAAIPWNYYYMESQEMRCARDYLQAQKWIEEGLERFPGNFYLEMLAASILFHLKDYAEARKSYFRLLERFSEPEELRYTFFNNIACVDLQLRHPELLEEADNYSRTALEKIPWNIFFKETRGSVLVERGALDEGTKLLLEALGGHHERRDRASSACYLAIAERARGDLAESRRFFAIARGLDPQCDLLERELPSAADNC
jgi:tetratricopeptide (TPR) repeat protein